MARIVLDPDEVHQDRVVTMTDGSVVELDLADRGTLDRIARQLHVHRSAYEHALGDGRPLAESPLASRVTELQEAHRQSHRRPATALDLSVLLQTDTWTSSSGAVHELRELTPSHRHNIMAWLERNSDALRDRFRAADLDDADRAAIGPADPWVAGTPLYRRLRDLVEAETGLERAKDQARQIARKVAYESTGDWPS